MNWLKHAFAIDGPEGEPTGEETALVDRLCREVVRRRLTVPAMVFLEVSRPLNTLGAQALHFFTPLLGMFSSPAPPVTSEGTPKTTPRPAHLILASYLERPGAIARMCDRLETLEKEHETASHPAESTDGPAL